MGNLFKARLLAVALLMVALTCAVVSCKDDDSPIGTGIMPSGDMMEFVCDTMGIQTFVVRDTHVETHNRTVNLIGIVNDPIFGQTSASCAFQVLLSTSNVQFSREIDIEDLSDVKLSLQFKYSSMYGSPSSLKLNVNRLLTDISFDSVYYDDTRFEDSQYELLVSTDINFGTDSIMKIDMPQELVESIVRQNAGQETWSNSDFIDFFKGLYFTTELNSGDGCIYALDLIGSKSKMVLTYNDTCSFDFDISEYSARINMYEHDYTNADSELKAAIDNPDQPTNYCFIQGLAGLKTKIKFPELANLFDSTNVIINRAQLKVSLKEGSEIDMLPNPTGMSMTKILDSGLYDFLEDYKSNSKNFGGSYNEADKSYTFNIPLHLQDLQKGENDNGIFMVANENRIIPYRAQLYGGAHENYSVKIIIYYSKY
jgi:hypothetical protein